MLAFVAKTQAALYGGGDRKARLALKQALMETKDRTRLSLVVVCPYCRVEAGQRCRNRDGKEISGHHHDRWLVVLPIWQHGVETGIQIARNERAREKVA